MSSNKNCELGIDCNKCKSRGMCTSYANHMYSIGIMQGRADALTEIITHIKACENEAYDNCEPLIGSVLMATRIKAEQLKEQNNDN